MSTDYEKRIAIKEAVDIARDRLKVAKEIVARYGATKAQEYEIEMIEALITKGQDILEKEYEG